MLITGSLRSASFHALSFSIALKRDKPDVMDAWIIDGRLTAEMGENITIARLRSPQYCIFRGEEEQVEALFEIDP